jgi:hypothetical protein
MAVDINGDGLIGLGGTSTTQGRLRLYEDTDNGTNYVEITAPASLTADRTLTLPDETGTIITTAGVPASSLPAGSVLQVVNVTYATDTLISTTTLTDTGLSASITPTSASNKILVLVNLSIGLNRAANLALECKARLLRGGTEVLNMGGTNGLGFRIGAGTDAIGRITLGGMISLSYLDSPATTSSTSYKMQAAPSTTLNDGAVRINWGGDVNSTITLMEIAA